MSGRKRALLHMNERDRKKLQKIEARLGSVDMDFSVVKSKIEEVKSQVSQQVETKRAEQREFFESSISHLDSRIQEIEAITQAELNKNVLAFHGIINSSKTQINDFTNLVHDYSTFILNHINKTTSGYDELISGISDEVEGLSEHNLHQQEIAWQNLSYAQEVFSNIENLYESQDQFATEFNRIGFKISTGWMNYQNESYQAALINAQESILEVTNLRFKIEQVDLNYEMLRVKAIEETMKILELAMNCQHVLAIDLDGNELEVSVDVDFWCGGLVNQAIQTLNSIQLQLSDSEIHINQASLNELVAQTLPAWNKALHDYVAQARIEVIASQSRYEVARTVVNALAEQGFELESGSFETNDKRLPYHVILGNLEGSSVHISVAPDEDNPLNYLLDIDSYDSEFRTESELRQRAWELLGSVQAAGLKVGQVYQADHPSNYKLRESPSVSYSVSGGNLKNRYRKPKLGG